MVELNKIHDIKVVTPGDKLLIRLSGVAGEEEFKNAQKLIVKWLNQGQILFVDKNCEVFIIQKDAKIELKKRANEELDKSKN